MARFREVGMKTLPSSLDVREFEVSAWMSGFRRLGLGFIPPIFGMLGLEVGVERRASGSWQVNPRLRVPIRRSRESTP